MTIYFANSAPINLAAIEIMGVNVKEGSSPIGYFGTGLKYAIATLLRHEQEITLVREGQIVEFEVARETVRGKDFSRVLMRVDGVARPLGFTTDLGKNWTLEMALRELESNCRDEGGRSGAQAPEGEWGTIFAIEGREFEHIYATQLDKIFLSLERKPLFETEDLQVFERRADDEASMMFYRGVRAYALPQPSLFLYNILKGELTEDRSIKYIHQSTFNICWAFAKACENPHVLRKVLLVGEGTWEHQGLNAWPWAISPLMCEIVKENRLEKALNPHAYQAWLQQGDNEEESFEKAIITPAMRKQFEAASALVQKLGVKLMLGDLVVVESLGNDTYGLARNGKIFIATRAFDLGTRFLASTIYEEFLHVKRGLLDESRGMQNFLFEKLFALLDGALEASDEAEGGKTLDESLRDARIQESGLAPIDDEISF